MKADSITDEERAAPPALTRRFWTRRIGRAICVLRGHGHSVCGVDYDHRWCCRCETYFWCPWGGRRKTLDAGGGW